MPNELVDIVDEHDEVVGQMMKDGVHEKRLPHRASCVFVFYKGKLLVQRRSPEKNGKLDPSASGHVGAGESYDVAAVRELREELGIDAAVTFVGKVWAESARPRATKYKHWYALFEVEITDEQYARLKPSPREVAELIPMTLTELADAIRLRRNEFSGALVLMLKMYGAVKHIEVGELPLEEAGN